MTGLKDKKFIDEALVAHNELRKMHGSSPLIHNVELSKIAQKWANIISARNRVEQSKNEYKNVKLGEVITLVPFDKNSSINGIKLFNLDNEC